MACAVDGSASDSDSGAAGRRAVTSNAERVEIRRETCFAPSELRSTQPASPPTAKVVGKVREDMEAAGMLLRWMPSLSGCSLPLLALLAASWSRDTLIASEHLESLTPHTSAQSK